MQTEQTQTQRVNAQKLYRMMQQGTTTGGTGAVGGDGFAAIFDQMAMSLMDGNGLAGLMDGNTGLFPGMMAGAQDADISELFQGEEEDSEDSKKTEDAMMQLAGAMLAQNPQFQAFLQMDDASAAELVSKLDLPAEAKQFLMDTRLNQMGSQQSQSQTAVSETAEEGAAAVMGNSVSQSQQSQSQSGGDGAQEGFAQILSGSQNSQSGSEAERTEEVQADFLRNIREAKELLSGKPEGQTAKKELDIDQLQKDVAANRFNPFASVQAKATASNVHAAKEQAPEISQQIQTGITENLLNGKKEFTMKLKPEGLGEITVKLLETSKGESTLSLITSSADVAKMINSKLTALQEAMRPLHVEVHQAVPQAPQTSQTGEHPDQTGAQQQFFMFEQQQPGSQQQAQQQASGNFFQTASMADDAVILEEPLQSVQADGLDTYI